MEDVDMSTSPQATCPDMFSGAFTGKRVLVTGHTGFKGSWLTRWLLRIGATVHGLALDPQPHEKLYDQLSLSDQIASDTRGDIRDSAVAVEVMRRVNPQVVLHLAAQPLVRLSFDQPVETFETNVMGSVNVLDAIRVTETPCVVIMVTTDKCYENREWLHSYRENDAMGGYDPYSASKGCAELVTSAYRRSFFSGKSKQLVASARAGNVIGGGDWAIDRIIPDVFRAVFNDQDVPVRNKHATRPWQHVLEPLAGYLTLAARLLHASETSSTEDPSNLCTAFNFGPHLDSNRTVADVVQAILQHTGGKWTDQSDPNALHEASKLNLAIDRAMHVLDWKPAWDFSTTIAETARWYLGEHQGEDPQSITDQQIDQYQMAISNPAK